MADSDDRHIEFDQLCEVEPFDWPGRQWVEQDNVGDWGGWLCSNDFDSWLEEVLQDPQENVLPLAEELARQYIADCRSAGFPMPAEYSESVGTDAALDEEESIFVEEFAAYLRTWQAAVKEKLRPS